MWLCFSKDINSIFAFFLEVARATAERQEGQVIAEFRLPSSLDAGNALFVMAHAHLIIHMITEFCAFADTGIPKEMVEVVCDAGMLQAKPSYLHNRHC